MTDFKNILVEIADGIMTVTINREKAMNALNRETIDELQKVLQDNWSNDEIACVIVTGAGKAFVAGADIKELAELDARGGTLTAARGQWLMKSLQNFPKPVIAAVNGFALGGGCELAMACDIRLASSKAKLGQPEVNLGIIPGYGGTQRLPRLVGRGKALQLILTGDMVNAAEAYRIGLVDEVYEPEELMEKAMTMAKTIASKGPLAIMHAKECVHRGLDIGLSAGCDLEKANFGTVCSTADKNEGMQAFIEKRKPDFKGK
ncbi:MAG TPA: enoyl-CoA hydratase-related protein [candidate division Zixibacteria bacterium]|nr:enoyl-CoA hydratase-related protein [candidate division Zixibacteria bacterium]